jgi:hypothetical protein
MSIDQDSGVPFEDLRAKGMFGMKVGRGKQERLRACYLPLK